MDREHLVALFKQMPWEVWLHRHFSPFVNYMMMRAGTRAGFATIGLDAQWPVALYDTDDWYDTEEMYRLAGEQAGIFLKQKDIFQLTAMCEERLQLCREEIPKLISSEEGPKKLFAHFVEIFLPANVFIWVAHASEQYYYPIIRKAAAQHVPEDQVETFVGDISFPSKKNALALFDADIRAGMPVHQLHEKYSWIKARGGFKPGYTVEEIEAIQQRTLTEPEPSHPDVEIPEDLVPLAEEVQELVYLRTLRTDAIYELYHLAQPLFRKVEEAYGITGIQNYIPDELIAGDFEYVPHEHAILKYYDDVLVVRDSIVSRTSVQASETSGVVAQRGTVTGTVRILEHANDSEKVQEGDVIVAGMTNPSFIAAMHRAAAFVTDEGGITCHAAIIAREMKKPCVIGTKNATQIFSDGDTVEVDAEKGVVRKV